MTRPTLTAVVPTRDDFHGCYFTVNSLLDHHGDYVDQVIVVDNSPKESEHAKLLKQAIDSLPRVKYDRIIGPESSCKYKDRGIRQAETDLVLCCDSHVLFPSGSIACLVDHFRQNPESQDLVMGPICKGSGKVMATHQALYEWEGVPAGCEVHSGVVCRGGNLGAWSTDPRGLDPEAAPFEIQQQGTGAFACRRAVWAGWPSSFNGHGGNETYLMESVRQGGGKVLCLPGFRWTHRFGRTSDWVDAKGRRTKVPYDMQWHHKASNYLTGFQLLDNPQLYDAVAAHLKKFCPQTITRLTKQIKRPLGLLNALQEKWSAAGGDPAGEIPPALLSALRNRTRGATYTLEFGSGLSTLLFDAMAKQHMAVEHDRHRHDQVAPLITRESTQLQLSEIEEGEEPWYSWRPSGEQYDLVLIDGPPGTIGRSGCRHYLADCLAPAAAVFIDDTHRPAEQQLSEDLCGMYGFTSRRVVAGGGRAFDLLTRQADTNVYEHGAGTELGKILKSRFGMEPLVSCGCKGKMREMNYRGLAWCKLHVDTIVEWLHKGAQTWKAQQEGLSGKITRVWLAIVPDFAERAVLRKLVEEAIAAADHSPRLISNQDDE